LFGAAAKRLPYIECSPQGQNAPQAQVCVDEDIKSYPTWIIYGKRYEDVLTMQDLAAITKFIAPNSTGR
jgi:hypothetical protein